MRGDFHMVNVVNLPHCGKIYHNVVQFTTMWYNLPQCGTIYHIVVKFTTMWYNLPQCGKIYHNVVIYLFYVEIAIKQW
jgi:hypothetical protein